MKKIPLTKDLFAQIDDEDYEKVSRHKWCALKGRFTYYACRSSKKDESIKRVTVLLHRFIVGVTEREVQVDHENGIGTDCQKINLRVCTNQQNQFNKNNKSNSFSKHKGVDYMKKQSKWRARIVFNKKEIHIGLYDTEIEASNAYDKKAIELFGKFARLNNIG